MQDFENSSQIQMMLMCVNISPEICSTNGFIYLSARVITILLLSHAIRVDIGWA